MFNLIQFSLFFKMKSNQTNQFNSICFGSLDLFSVTKLQLLFTVSTSLNFNTNILFKEKIQCTYLNSKLALRL